jgi:signal transduction histidine kinase
VSYIAAGEKTDGEEKGRSSAQETMARRLAFMVAFAGLAPIFLMGLLSVEVLRRQSQSAGQDALEAVARQAAARIEGYLESQKETLRTAAAAGAGSKEAVFRLEEVVLDAPSLGRVTLVGPDNPNAEPPPKLDAAAIDQARRGKEVSSSIYFGADLTPAMDFCTPARTRPGHAVCAEFDLLELWRFVQRIRVGESGYALAFDSQGRVLASGAGPLRAAILTGEPVAESDAAARASKDIDSAPRRYAGPFGEDVLAGWALLKNLGWTVVVEQPVREALRGARIARWVMTAVALLGLIACIMVGLVLSRRMLASMEVTERWSTAGRIAAGITHDLGHRVAILQQTAGLAETGDPVFLPRIRDNLKSEVGTLRKFVADFADLSRDVKVLDLYPIELNSFAQSICRTAQPHAERSGVRLAAVLAQGNPWVKADRYLLERAVMNLLSNAIEASKRDTEVRVQVTQEPGRAVLAVVDRGQGIERERLGRIFDAFRSTKRTGAHVGMGLPNVKRIVEAHHGKVAVESELGVGTSFQISLPVVAPPSTPLPRPSGGLS